MADSYTLPRHLKVNIAQTYELVKRIKTSTSSSRSDLDPVSNAKSFIICHRDDSGETNFRYEPNDDVAICVVKSINICRSMLRNSTVQNAFTEMAKSYSQTDKTAWFLQEESPEHEEDMSRVADGFLQKILNGFPIVFVDHGWENRRMMGANFRGPWDGKFESSSTYISLNGAVSGNRAASMKKVLEQADQTLGAS